jgi:1-acyl-sn-glycerol-3-phosphate acyltransferase
MESTVPDRQTTRLYRALRSLVRLLLRFFFRELEVTGVEQVPRDRGLLLVSWHPNGLVDPALLLALLPRPLTFGARHGLFEVPLLGSALRGLGTIPIYRAVDTRNLDPERRREANRASVDALAVRVAEGSVTALFPEGVSHDAPHLMELRPGAAHLYYRARGLRGSAAPAPEILPVGLHYDKKRSFRSRALVWFHRPLRLPPELDRDPEPGESEELVRTRARRLTAAIERELRDVIHATEDWRTHELLHRVRKLVGAERALRSGEDSRPQSVSEATRAFADLRAAYYRAAAADPGRVAALRARLDRYDRELRALGIDDHQLDRGPRLASPWLGLVLVLNWAALLLVAPPLLLLGYLANGPAFVAVRLFARSQARLDKDVATLKILAGIVVYPASWLVIAGLVAWAHSAGHALFPQLPGTPWMTGLGAAVCAMVGGWLAVRYVSLLKETWNALRVRLTRARSRAALARLRDERARLYDELSSLARAAAAAPRAAQPAGPPEVTERT